ncbi:head maturation protease, ClpP-related [Macrococcus bovicus]|uniref:ATP-dependent Clp protease proteolytic subunit n=1 Tax=Macrococcus bovicus TaxID=69968 RepID=A0A4R6C2Y8_9STAP|nr:head maturation protease, ClpP-related [Macrococcus bovicus]TDM15705.1 Clp protease ClpP [Macrococcus bovicus]
MTKNSILMLKQEGTVGTIDIYGEIVPEGWRWFEDEVSAYSFKSQLERFEGVTEIVLNINSPGGEVYEGVAIYNMLKRHPVKVTANIDGLCASVATIIAMAADEINMPENAMMMVHNAMMGVFGNHNDFREAADYLEKLTDTVTTAYLDKSEKLNRETLKALLDAETWLTAEEAFSYGLIDNVITANKMVACATKEQLSKYSKTPAKVFNSAGRAELLNAYADDQLIEQRIKLVETPEETSNVKGLDINLQLSQGYKEMMNMLEEVRILLLNERTPNIDERKIEQPKQKFRYY